MSKKKTGRETSHISDDEDVPAWVADESLDRTTPYSEEELDVLEEGTWEGIRDTAAWEKLVARVGEEEARRVLRSRLIMNDENARRQTRH